MGSYRQQKVAQELQRCIASALLYDIDDDELHAVTITYVRQLRRMLAEQVNLRRVPQLRFHYDESLERGMRMEALLKRLREEGQMGDEPPTDSPANPPESDVNATGISDELLAKLTAMTQSGQSHD